MHIFDDVLDIDLIDRYKIKIETHYLKMLSEGKKYDAWYPTRNFKLGPNDSVVPLVQEILFQQLGVYSDCLDCELQTWPIGIESKLHIHDANDRETGDYNSLLYLNDDFYGGEFYTGNGITIKPKKNRLTFFDGRKIYHGVRTVENQHRFTMIFWWGNTKKIKPIR